MTCGRGLPHGLPCEQSDGRKGTDFRHDVCMSFQINLRLGVNLAKRQVLLAQNLKDFAAAGKRLLRLRSVTGFCKQKSVALWIKVGGL